MFSIISTGFLRILVWYSPGSQAISTLAPRWAHPASDPRTIPGPSLIPSRMAAEEVTQPHTEPAPGGSHTPARSSVRESSHTQEFARLQQPRWPRRPL